VAAASHGLSAVIYTRRAHLDRARAPSARGVGRPLQTRN
jgi:hypothetical protein